MDEYVKEFKRIEINFFIIIVIVAPAMPKAHSTRCSFPMYIYDINWVLLTLWLNLWSMLVITILASSPVETHFYLSYLYTYTKHNVQFTCFLIIVIFIPANIKLNLVTLTLFCLAFPACRNAKPDFVTYFKRDHQKNFLYNYFNSYVYTCLA